MNKDHTSHLTGIMSTEGIGQDHKKLVHQGDIGVMLLIGDTGMKVISTDQIVAIVIN